MARRKRAPGGGRKPKGPIRGKSTVFSTRITPETREALDREAAERGHSLSQVFERLLWAGLEAKARSRSMRAIRALSYLFERIALAAANAKYEGTLARLDKKIAHLQVDPFAYQAFKAAIRMLLDYFEPQGPVVSPLLTRRPQGVKGPLHITEDERNWFGRFFETPEVYGAYIFSHLLSELGSEEPTIIRKSLMMNRATARPASFEFYGIQDARRDLSVPNRSPEED